MLNRACSNPDTITGYRPPFSSKEHVDLRISQRGLRSHIEHKYRSLAQKLPQPRFVFFASRPGQKTAMQFPKHYCRHCNRIRSPKDLENSPVALLKG